MRALLTVHGVLLLFVLVRAGDLAVTYAIARDLIRAILYGIVALLALVVLILILLGQGGG